DQVRDRPRNHFLAGHRPCGAGGTAQCHLVFRLSKMRGASSAPCKAWVGASFTAFRKSALSGHVEHSEKLLVVLRLSGSGDQFGPSMINHSQHLGETELARVQTTASGRPAHDCAYEIVSGDG